uniref:Uncharacterized protein n=1 Tax=Chromera velia CCMP2878 TaxID=1169474 RepID=A0A0G4H6N6_9ALVE|eukprot:Cvel_24874.t1-p1 / transcript=Cvel_24874.t1 / gene=Cvel_24874 / organism=Chromera_velia_CCMP2878 / gene_product=hypothetical protein / transcript_product=hypothetical protein / location=Cvel_scaffold2748:20327-21397(+) / protein_length=357 / sequence_SO=supercontig / SO=protein_coding / is_pseudo=false
MLGPYPMLSPPLVLERGGVAGAQRPSGSRGVQAYTEQELAKIEQLEKEVAGPCSTGRPGDSQLHSGRPEEEENVSQLTGAALEEAIKKFLTKQKDAKQRKKEMKRKRKQVEQIDMEIATKQGEIASLQDRINRKKGLRGAAGGAPPAGKPVVGGVGAFELRLGGAKSEEGESRPVSSSGVTGTGVIQVAAVLAILGIAGIKPGVVATRERPDPKEPKICMSLEQILRGVPQTYVELRDRMAYIIAAYFLSQCQFAESSVILHIRRKAASVRHWTTYQALLEDFIKDMELMNQDGMIDEVGDRFVLRLITGYLPDDIGLTKSWKLGPNSVDFSSVASLIVKLQQVLWMRLRANLSGEP